MKYDEYSDKLNLNLVFEVFNISDQFFSLFIDIIEKTINLWNGLIKGLPNLYILLDKAIILAKKMIEC